MDVSHGSGGRSESGEREKRRCSSAHLTTVSNKSLSLSLPRLGFTILSAGASLNEAAFRDDRIVFNQAELLRSDTREALTDLIWDVFRGWFARNEKQSSEGSSRLTWTCVLPTATMVFR